MRITVLGSGTLLSGPQRMPSAFLLESGNSKAVLDMGPGILAQIHRLNINPLKIKTIFLSHFHLDHCADVFPLLMNRFLLKSDANKDLVIFGPVDIKGWFDKIASTQGAWLHNYLPVVLAMDQKHVEWAGYNLSVQLNKHTKTSVAYRFTGKRTYFFSSDTGYNEDLIDFAAGSEIRGKEMLPQRILWKHRFHWSHS